MQSNEPPAFPEVIELSGGPLDGLVMNGPEGAESFSVSQQEYVRYFADLLSDIPASQQRIAHVWRRTDRKICDESGEHVVFAYVGLQEFREIGDGCGN